MTESTSIFSGYVTPETFAADPLINKTPRSIYRWMRKRDGGLPYVVLGNRRLIHVETAQAWLMSQMRRPNPERRHRPRPARKR